MIRITLKSAPGKGETTRREEEEAPNSSAACFWPGRGGCADVGGLCSALPKKGVKSISIDNLPDAE